jgi:hypothetical protein
MREADDRPAPDETEEGETAIDPIDPLKRGDDEEMPGLDPVVTPIPPE